MNKSIVYKPGARIIHFLTIFGFALWGCSERGDSSVDGVKPQIVSFAASPEEIEKGESSRLSWKVIDATSIALKDESGVEIDIGGEDSFDGGVTLSPDETTRFILMAFGLDGEDAIEAETVISVVGENNGDDEDAEDSRIISFLAAPDQIEPGEESVLSWTTVGADELTLQDDAGNYFVVEDNRKEDGSIAVTLFETTKFTLILVGANGESSRELTVLVDDENGSMIRSFNADPAHAIVAGTEVTLSWKTELADRVMLLRDGVEVLSTEDSAINEYKQIIDLHSVFTLVAESESGERNTATRSIPVIPVIQLFDVDHVDISSGDTVRFSWRTVGTSSISLTGPGGVEHQEEGERAAQGDFSTEIFRGGAFVLTAKSGFLEDERSVSVLLNSQTDSGLEIVHFEQGEDIISLGGSFSITWEITDESDSSSLEISLYEKEVLGRDFDLSSYDPYSDTAIIEPRTIGHKTYVFSATNNNIDFAYIEFDINVVMVPGVLLFQADPTAIYTEDGPDSAESSLSWLVEHAVELGVYEVDQFGELIQPPVYVETKLDSSSPHSGEVTLTPDKTTRYRIVASNLAGNTAIEEVKVQVDGARVFSFEADPLEIPEGATVMLSWETSRAESVSLYPVTMFITEIEEDFVDISSTGDPIALRDTSRYWDLDFPNDFVFPYFGADRTQVRIGYYALISFQFDDGFRWINPEITAGANSSSPLIAAFWDQIRAKDESSDHAFYQFGSDQDGDYLRVQWNNYEFVSSVDNPSSLTIQIVLRDDGSFEFHYADMDGETDRKDGSGASIGYDNADGTAGYSFSYERPVAGGLANRAWRYSPEFPQSGTYEVRPVSDTIYELSAHSEDGDDWAYVSILVHPAVKLNSLDVRYPIGKVKIDPEDEFGIQWSGAYAHVVSVYDPDGNLMYQEDLDGSTHQNGVIEGLIAPEEAGEYTYTVELVGAFDTDIFQREIDIEVGLEIENPFSGCVDSPEWICVGSSPGLIITDNDPNGIDDMVEVADTCLVEEINIDIHITHTWIADLKLEIESPYGAKVVLHNNQGGMAHDIIGNYPGTIDPYVSLDAFQGVDAKGEWQIFITDSYAGDVGILNSWSLNISCADENSGNGDEANGDAGNGDEANGNGDEANGDEAGDQEENGDEGNGEEN